MKVFAVFMSFALAVASGRFVGSRGGDRYKAVTRGQGFFNSASYRDSSTESASYGDSVKSSSYGDSMKSSSYGDSTKSSSYGGSSIESSSYGEPPATSDYGSKCETYYDTVGQDRCEQYTDEVCTKTHQESCDDVDDQRCSAIVSSSQVRKCFNVTELVCGLKESIQYDTIQAVFNVQKCHKVTERVCDTVYEPDAKPRDDLQCITVRNPYCTVEEKTVIDKTCRTSTHFDCNEGYGSADSGGAGAGSSYGSTGCKRSTDTKCYDTPRTMSQNKCWDREEEVCKKLTEQVPYPVEKQVCHEEVKRVCELEERTQPKQVKKYVYTEDCRPVRREVCDNAEVKKLVPSCVKVSKKQCSMSPVENCDNVPKEHCYKEFKRVKKQRCGNNYS